jgi:hypothetical protein
MDNKNMAITFSYANIKRYERKDATRPVGKGDVIFCDFTPMNSGRRSKNSGSSEK